MFGKKTKHPETPMAAKPAAPGAATPKATGTSAKSSVSNKARGPGQNPDQGNGKLAYETRRAEKAGMGLEKWMAEKDRRARAERDALSQAKRKSDVDRQNQAAKPGLLRRLLDRAHRPI